jgi:hypothetical protein
MPAITLNDLTVNFRHLDPMALLDDWRWLIGERKRAVLITALGDAFVQDPDDGFDPPAVRRTGDPSAHRFERR